MRSKIFLTVAGVMAFGYFQIFVINAAYRAGHRQGMIDEIHFSTAISKAIWGKDYSHPVQPDKYQEPLFPTHESNE